MNKPQLRPEDTLKWTTETEEALDSKGKLSEEVTGENLQSLPKEKKPLVPRKSRTGLHRKEIKNEA